MGLIFFIMTEQDCVDALMELAVPQEPKPRGGPKPILDPHASTIPLMELPPPTTQTSQLLTTVLTRIIKSVFNHPMVDDYVVEWTKMEPVTRLREWNIIRGYVKANNAALLHTHIRMMSI